MELGLSSVSHTSHTHSPKGRGGCDPVHLLVPLSPLEVGQTQNSYCDMAVNWVWSEFSLLSAMLHLHRLSGSGSHTRFSPNRMPTPCPFKFPVYLMAFGIFCACNFDVETWPWDGFPRPVTHTHRWGGFACRSVPRAELNHSRTVVPTRKLGRGALLKNPVFSVHLWLLNSESAFRVRFWYFSV